jgi:pSer/pThr/pTyr-binding forkhead associated (FHA) protein
MKKIWMGAIAGLLAAVVTWPLTLPFLPYHDELSTDIASGFCLGTFYGWSRNALFGGLGGLFIVFVYTLGRTRSERVKAMVIAAILGGVLVTCGHALKDWITIKALESQGREIGPHMLLLFAIQCLTEPMGLCIAIACAMGFGRGMLLRLPLGIGLAWIAATVSLFFAELLIIASLVSAAVASGGRQPGGDGNPWFISSIAFLIEQMVIGAAVGACLALADTIVRRAWLERAVGRNEGYAWDLDRPVCRIGSAEGIEVRAAPLQGFGGYHAQIQRFEAYYAIQDLGCGVFLNGYPVVAAWLSDGDVLTLGPYQFVFRLRGAQPRRMVDVPPAAEVPLAASGPVPLSAVAGWAAPATPAAGVAPAPSPPSIPTPMPAAVPTTAAPVTVISDKPPARLSDDFGNSYSLVGDSVVVGRDAACGVSLSWEITVSRRHAEIAFGPTGATVRDLGSSNGTRLNGSAVSADPVPLREGDVLEFGKARLTFKG